MDDIDIEYVFYDVKINNTENWKGHLTWKNKKSLHHMYRNHLLYYSCMTMNEQRIKNIELERTRDNRKHWMQ